VVQATSTLIERETFSRITKLEKSDNGLTSDKPYGAPQWAGVFVQDWLGIE
jgi:hypothetical protein